MESQIKYDFDVAIIGGGSGGYAAAQTTARAGRKTAVIESGAELGGLCILRGCMPTKALLYAAERIHLVRQSAAWGIETDIKAFDFTSAMARKDAIIKEFTDYRVEQLNAGKFKLIRTHAKFLDAHTLELGDGNKLSAKNFVIATGSRIAPSPFPFLDTAGYITSDDALKFTRLPKSLIILGAGAIGAEFAQCLSRFGVKITVIQRSAHILHDFDADMAAEMENVLRREGIELFTNTKLLAAVRDGDSKVVSFEHKGQIISVCAEEILFALGRVPATESLGLENAGVETVRGRIVCDEFMRTTGPHIFAAGDCTGPRDIVHVAVMQGEVAAHNILKPESRKLESRLHMGIVFTDPHAAFVGRLEKELKAQKIPYLAASYPFNDHGKSLIMDAKDGFVKLMADKNTGEILGGACVGPAGGELIHEITVAMSKRMTVHELAAVPHYHPTLAEIWTYPAEELAKKIIVR